MNFKAWLNEDIFDDMFADTKKRGNPVKKQRKSEPYTFDLYRGFDADLDSLEKQGDKFVLSPEKSEQGMMWFTHMFINGYNPREYVAGRGQWLLTYPLQAKKHYDEVTYEDGSVRTESPDEIMSKAIPTENSRFGCFGKFCLELPQGWYFTYKMEKFIATKNKITVSPSMISTNTP